MSLCRNKLGHSDSDYSVVFQKEILIRQPLWWGRFSVRRKARFKKQFLCLRICWEGDGWHHSYDFENCRKRRGATARQRGGGGWEKASQEELRKGEENVLAVYAACKRPFCRYCVFVS